MLKVLLGRARRARYFFIALAFASFVNRASADSGGGQALGIVGGVLGGALIVSGLSSLAKDYKDCTTGVGCAKIAKDLLEIGGGGVALAASLMNQSDQAQSTGTDIAGSGGKNSSTGSFSSNSSTPTLVDLSKNCNNTPELCKCNDASCNAPVVTIPPLDNLKDLIRRDFNGQAFKPDGTGLNEALAGLDNSYKKAADAVDALNKQSDAGGFGAAPTNIADTSSGTTHGEGGPGVDASNKAAGLLAGTGSTNSGLNSADFAGLAGSKFSLDGLFDQRKKERDAKPVKGVGMNLEDAHSGKVLTIWERNTRALRGSRDRDLIMAKMEWIRREAMQKAGKLARKDLQDTTKSNFAVSREKP